jgi:hypothetical protein
MGNDKGVLQCQKGYNEAWEINGHAWFSLQMKHYQSVPGCQDLQGAEEVLDQECCGRDLPRFSQCYICYYQKLVSSET